MNPDALMKDESSWTQRVRGALAARPMLWRIYRQLRQRLLNEHPEPGPIHRVLATYALESTPVRFVQIGSNDAAFGDPIIDFVLRHGWSGVMVEPVPNIYARLRRRHGANPRLRFENLAIDSSDGSRVFYSLQPLAAPPSPWYDQMGSFSREHILKHERFTPGLAQHIRETTVECLRLDTLLARHGIRELQLLHIDAEGHDYAVLQSLDFSRCQPELLLFEHGHLPREERTACAAFLEARGYRLLHEGRDCLALHAAAHARRPATARLFDALAPET